MSGARERLADASIKLTIDAFDALKTLAGVATADGAILAACTIVEARLKVITWIETTSARDAEHRRRTVFGGSEKVTSYREANVDENVP